ncbi:MAG: 1-deoxy-D-xylulose-5-phosphate reductoisomerase [Proteobacteria bacterium]|nr:1-deoxy-D-xylulose-5-phosphate reductoisomerase [Pseudomonadota bacterium]
MISRTLAVLGSTGTIGNYTLQIVDKYPGQFRVVSLSCAKNIEKLIPQIEKYRPSVVSIEAYEAIPELKKRFPEVKFFSGREGISACLQTESIDVAIVGVVGFAGLEPTVQALRHCKIVGLANKESLVVAGTLLKKEIANSKAVCVPVDSEHNAVYQVLMGRRREEIGSIVLTASGGPLLKHPEMALEDVTPAFAVAHPNWKMGPKISVDSATMMNKGLEVIEAHFLFDFPEKEIEVWVHPQSIVHGAVWFKDASCIAQLTKPDMKSSIGYAMKYPDRLDSVIPKLTLKEMANLEFFEPDLKRFPCLRLAREALLAGPSYLVVLNAANEIAVDAFLNKKIRFSEIPTFIEKQLRAHENTSLTTFEEVIALDQLTRDKAV